MRSPESKKVYTCDEAEVSVELIIVKDEHDHKSACDNDNFDKEEHEDFDTKTAIRPTMLDITIERLIPKTTKGKDFVQICGILTASLGGFSAGAHLAWLSPSVPKLLLNSSYIGPITLDEASYFSVITPIFTIIFSFVVGNAMKIIGRKHLIGFMAVPHIISWLLIATAQSIVPIYISRAFNGISDAVTVCTSTVYIGEITTPLVRGKWGNMLMCAIFFGHLSVVVVGVYCDIVSTAYIFLIPPVLQILFTMVVPESPYFLIMRGRDNEAMSALRRFRWKKDVREEFSAIKKDIEAKSSESGVFSDLFCNATNRKALWIVMALFTFVEYSGLPGFVTYAQYLFQLAGGTSLSAEVSSIIFFSVLFLLTVSASSVVGNYSRRTMMIISSFGCAISLLMEAIFFYVKDETALDVSHISWVPLLGMLCYIIFLSAGLSRMPFLMIGELFSPGIKNYAVFIASSYQAVNMIIVPKLLQLLVTNFSMYVPFMFFTCSCLIATIFCYLCVPETRGRTLEEIQRILNSKT
uniref:Major facilitator superfamily (MFS) profile domain-containing protein n=1 Tax=Photinus pyralis TaxID=7054 RepID=A0A1Y1KSD3_PHOPY